MGQQVAIGTHRWFDELGIESAAVGTQQADWETAGKTVVLVAIDGQLQAAIAVADTIKPTSAQAIRALQRMGLEMVMLTGDNHRTATAIAQRVGIDRVFAQVRPDQKAATIQMLQTKERRIEQPLPIKVGVVLGGLTLVGAELWWFLGRKHWPSWRASSTCRQAAARR